MTSKVKDVLLAIALLVSLGCFFYGYIQQTRATTEAETSVKLMTALENQKKIAEEAVAVRIACEKTAIAAYEQAEKNRLLAEDLLKKSKK